VVVGVLITEKKEAKELARNVFTVFIPLFENAAKHARCFRRFMEPRDF